MSERNLFICFPESDGGHSYLAAREMLNPKSVAHLLFRNTVAESFEAVAAGQATYAVVPAYNSITQWDGATLKALATGGYEIYGQVCMPTSYVLVAHTDYIDEFLQSYTSIKELGENATPEEKAKIYTRFLTKIYVGAHADEQYRGRLIRPDLKNSTVELSRNPLRVLEELSRSDQMMQMMKVSRDSRQDKGIWLGGGTTTRVIDTVHAPAALVAAGLLDAPGDPEGWDQPGSLGEIVALLRKLLVLLNVYSFGAPDLPENTTQYLLIGRRGEAVPAKDALKLPATVTTRIMTMVRPVLKKSSAAQWRKPYEDLTKIAKPHGFVFDRAPLTVSSGKTTTFLLEGGKLKEGSILPKGWWSDGTSTTTGKNTLRKQIEKRPSGDKPADSRLFLGEYPSWCYGLSHKPGEARCCDEPHDAEAPAIPFDWLTLLRGAIATAIAITVIGLAMFLWCMLTGSCGFSNFRPQDLKIIPGPSITAPNSTSPSGTVPTGATPGTDQPANTGPSTTQTSTPGLYPNLPPTTAPTTSPSSSGATSTTTAPLGAPQNGHPPLPNLFSTNIVFEKGKANLSAKALTNLKDAATHAQGQQRTNIMLQSRDPDENDPIIARQRLQAVRRQLLEFSVPDAWIGHLDTKPAIVTIEPKKTASPAPATTPSPSGAKSPAPAVTTPSPSGATGYPFNGREAARCKTTEFRVVFAAGSSSFPTNDREALNSAAAQSAQLSCTTRVRAVTQGSNEAQDIWQRRRLSLEDELVRLGVARNRITHEQTRTQLIIVIKPETSLVPTPGKRAALDIDAVADPMMGDY